MYGWELSHLEGVLDQPLIFLSHSGADTQEAKHLAHVLRQGGVNVWLDVEELKPGDLWMDELDAALQRADAFAVYVGRSGVRQWVSREVRVALDRNTLDPSFHVFPILGPGADVDSLPTFLTQHQWVDLRAGNQSIQDIQRLLHALVDKPVKTVSLLDDTRPPFCGLRPFDIEDALLFYGRDQEIGTLLERVRSDPFFAVVGDSGSGKSSLVRAGLLPALQRGQYHNGNTWVHT